MVEQGLVRFLLLEIYSALDLHSNLGLLKLTLSEVPITCTDRVILGRQKIQRLLGSPLAVLLFGVDVS